MIRPSKGTPRSDNERLEDIMWKICDRYCKHPARLITTEELVYRCERCPLNELVDYVDELRGKSSC